MLIEILEDIVAIDSPSGYTEKIIKHIFNKIKGKEFKKTITNKGALLVSTVENPELVVSGHIDTLGAMVSGLNGDGTLALTQLGGWPVPSFEGEYVTVCTAKEKKIRGTFILKNPAAHVNREVGSTKRDMNAMCVRLDAEVSSRKELEKLGISIGDFLFFDPRFEYTKTGFIKSRFMDDKACSAAMLDIILNYKQELKGKSVAFYFSNFEEVGHGATSGIPTSAKELLVADMGVVGDGVAGDEFHVSICAKDSSGPYDFAMRNKLVSLAKKNKIPYKVDIFPFYGSDGSAALSAGYNLRVGLIGPGVSASHGVERTHIKGLEATQRLILAYIKAS